LENPKSDKEKASSQQAIRNMTYVLTYPVLTILSSAFTNKNALSFAEGIVHRTGIEL
jgi:hypothetical protein